MAKPVVRSSTPVRVRPSGFARRAVLEQLEPRLLLSADLNPLAGDALLAPPSTLSAEFRSLTDLGTPSVVISPAAAPAQRTNELVFVDTATPDYQRLVDDMRATAQSENRNLEVVLIDWKSDGIATITDTLAKHSDLDAVHIISHARDGDVQLGNTELDFQTLVKRAGEIKKWGDALAAGGDILFYGCDLAENADGRALVDAIARLTGADVAASKNLTGSAAQGGDWTLEFNTGAIEAQVLVSKPEQAQWDHLLATILVTSTNDTGSGSLRTAIAQANAAAGPDTIQFALLHHGPELQRGRVDDQAQQRPDRSNLSSQAIRRSSTAGVKPAG